MLRTRRCDAAARRCDAATHGARGGAVRERHQTHRRQLRVGLTAELILHPVAFTHTRIELVVLVLVTRDADAVPRRMEGRWKIFH